LTPEQVTKRRSTRSGDGGAINAGEESVASGSMEWSYGRERCGVQLGSNLTDALLTSLFIYSLRRSPSARGRLRPLRPLAGPSRPGPRALVGQAIFGSGTVFLQGNQPAAVILFFIFCLFSLQFKFEFEVHFNSYKPM
jgi:hypothetical protein